MCSENGRSEDAFGLVNLRCLKLVAIVKYIWSSALVALDDFQIVYSIVSRASIFFVRKHV